jgi:hypothetical protein
MADAVEQLDVRGINVSKAVTGYANMMFKMKQVCAIQKSSNWREDYYQETNDVLTGGTEHNVKGVPRLAEFPYLNPTWTKASSYHIKHAGMTIISYEDEISDGFNVIQRASYKIGEAIAYSVDEAIYYAITNDAAVNTAAATDTWDSATAANRDPIRDLLTGIAYMAIDNYDFLQNGYILMSPTDYKNCLMNSKVINNPSFKTADVVSNGVVGQLCGGKIIVANAVDTDECAMVIGNIALAYKVLAPLQTSIENHPGIKKVISGWEVGITQVLNPEAIHIITNTQA